MRATACWCTGPGAAEVLDYSAGPISGQLGAPVDAVLDLVGGYTLADAPKQVNDPARIASVIDLPSLPLSLIFQQTTCFAAKHDKN